MEKEVLLITDQKDLVLEVIGKSHTNIDIIAETDIKIKREKGPMTHVEVVQVGVAIKDQIQRENQRRNKKNQMSNK